MREEDNIEKEGLQEDNPDIGDNSGDEDFAEYDDLSALEQLFPVRGSVLLIYSLLPPFIKVYHDIFLHFQKIALVCLNHHL